MMRRFLTISIFAALSAGAGFAADAKAGQAAFDKSCKSCHGPDGTPNPAVGKMMKVEMKDLKSAEVQSRSDAGLEEGDHRRDRAKWKPIAAVTGSSVDDVVAYVRSLKK